MNGDIDLSGYIDVAERIREFKKTYPQGVLRPWNPDEPFKIVSVGEKQFIVYTAAAFRTPDDPLPAVAVAWEPAVGRTPYTRDSELMNAETSAWGRAIVAALVGETKRIASAEEVRNRQADQKQSRSTEVPRSESPRPQTASSHGMQPTAKQMNYMKALIKQVETDDATIMALIGATSLEDVTGTQAKQAIEDLLRIKNGQAVLVYDTEGKPFLQ